MAGLFEIEKERLRSLGRADVERAGLFGTRSIAGREGGVAYFHGTAHHLHPRAAARSEFVRDAFARLDTAAAVAILKEDDAIDREFDNFVRKLITYMMEDPGKISASLDLLFLAKAIERIGDHSKNIAEFIIYVVKGADVRHASMEVIESAVK